MERHAREATLGNLIDWLNEVPEENLNKPCYFKLHGICTLVFRFLSSYRGYYDQLAIVMKEESAEQEPPTIRGVRQALCGAVGSTFTGHKGGEYLMERITVVRVVNMASTTSMFKPVWDPEENVFVLVCSEEDIIPSCITIDDTDTILQQAMKKLTEREREVIRGAMRK